MEDSVLLSKMNVIARLQLRIRLRNDMKCGFQAAYLDNCPPPAAGEGYTDEQWAEAFKFAEKMMPIVEESLDRYGFTGILDKKRSAIDE